MVVVIVVVTLFFDGKYESILVSLIKSKALVEYSFDFSVNPVLLLMLLLKLVSLLLVNGVLFLSNGFTRSYDLNSVF